MLRQYVFNSYGRKVSRCLKNLSFLQRVQKALRSFLHRSLTACALKRCALLADRLRFTAHLPMLTASVYGLALRLASFWYLIALALQLQTLSTKTSPTLLGKTILVRMPPLQSALTAQMTSSETPISLLSEQKTLL